MTVIHIPPDGSGPLKPTLARWYNKKRRRHDDHDGWTEWWVKSLAHTGPVTQFAYGTNTPSPWNGRFQKCQVCSIVSGAIAVDADGPEFASTRTARFITPELAFTRRCEFHWHALIDSRLVPAQDWPGQGPIAGGDIKSAGWIPVPGSRHWTDDLYELAHDPAMIVPATPALMAAIIADRADEDARRRAQGRHTGKDGPAAAMTAGATTAPSPEPCWATSCGAWTRSSATPNGSRWP